MGTGNGHEPRPQSPLVSLRNFTQKNGHREPALLFLDGPNFWYGAEDMGRPMPFDDIIRYFTQDHEPKYEIVGSFAFHNSGCPWRIEREFKRRGFSVIRCVPEQAPPLARAGEGNDRIAGACRPRASDAVDGGMIEFITTMAQISHITTFIIASDDGVFERIGHQLLHRGKIAHWVRIRADERRILVHHNFDDKDVKQISDLKQETNALSVLR